MTLPRGWLSAPHDRRLRRAVAKIALSAFDRRASKRYALLAAFTRGGGGVAAANREFAAGACAHRAARAAGVVRDETAAPARAGELADIELFARVLDGRVSKEAARLAAAARELVRTLPRTCEVGARGRGPLGADARRLIGARIRTPTCRAE